jgi:hypothetical protein
MIWNSSPKPTEWPRLIRAPRVPEFRAVFLGWHCFSLGAHLDLLGPHIEIHLPGGWFGLGLYRKDVWQDWIQKIPEPSPQKGAS